MYLPSFICNLLNSSEAEVLRLKNLTISLTLCNNCVLTPQNLRLNSQQQG